MTTAEFAIASIVAAACMAIGLLVGMMIMRSLACRLAAKMETFDSHVELCRRALLETKEEMGNIYQFLQTAEAQQQRRDMADLTKIEKMMRDQMIDGVQAMPPMESHPPVGSHFGSARRGPAYPPKE